jgi:hypothetical protein
LGLLEAAGGAGTAADFFELMIPRVYRKWLQGKTGTRAKKFQGGGLKKYSCNRKKRNSIGKNFVLVSFVI